MTAALEQLGDQLFRQLLSVVEDKLTIALQEILEQPIKFRAEADFKRKAATVEFSIERDGNQEDILRGQGGSVANILSVGLRLFALTTLDEQHHRRFLVLDEQDCWLRPDLVPRLVKIVHDAGKALGFQVLMISHHDVATFDRFAEKIYQFIPRGSDGVEVREIAAQAPVPDEVAPRRDTKSENRVPICGTIKSMLVELGGHAKLGGQGVWPPSRKPQGVILQILVTRQKVRWPQFQPMSGGVAGRDACCRFGCTVGVGTVKFCSKKTSHMTGAVRKTGNTARE